MSLRSEPAGFVHQAGIYGSDTDFLSMALPFVSAGLAAGEPVLAVTTPANLELLGHALGSSAREIDYAETAYFGRRPIQRVSAFHRYWRRQAEAGHQWVRILAEAVWTGRSLTQILAWQRMESNLNLALDGTGIHMICPYDTRVLGPEIVDTARRTHPVDVQGVHTVSCAEFTDPREFIDEYDAVPLPPPPADAASAWTDGEPRSARHFAATVAAGFDLPEERIAMLTLAVGEAADYLAGAGYPPITIRIWAEFGAIVCELKAPTTRVTDPVMGLCPPEITSGFDPEGSGVWLVRQLCDQLEIRTTGESTTMRLYLPGPRAEELLQMSVPYTR